MINLTILKAKLLSTQQSFQESKNTTHTHTHTHTHTQKKSKKSQAIDWEKKKCITAHINKKEQ